MKRISLCLLFFILCSTMAFSQEFYPMEIDKSGKGVKYIQNEKELTYGEFKSIMKSSPYSAEQFRKGQVNLNSGLAVIGLSIVPYVLMTFSPEGSAQAFGFAVAGACFTIGGVVLSLRGLGMMQKKAVLLYNYQGRGTDNESAMLHFGLTNDGVGLSLRF